MNKKFLSMAAAAMMFAACSENSLQPEPIEVAKTPAVAGQTPIGFSAYTDRGVTRAGATGELTTNGTTSLASNGFGVFAYYTDNKEYAGKTKPDFMYNQKVTSDGSNWTYTPVKYWPNEYGASAESADIDLVSFFAYAPYVDVTDPAQGTVANAGSGIAGFSRNNANGDPLVKYITTFNTANQVDLSWGTVHSDSRIWKTLTGADHTFSTGAPWKDVEHPASIDQKMKFNFLHALAQLNVQIDVDADEVTHYNAANGPAEDTKVYVRSISFTGFTQKAALNLNNTSNSTPLWMNFNGQGLLSEETAEPVTLNDGRKNGKEGVSSASENNSGNLNATIISDAGNTTEGVTGTLKNLFNVTNFTGDDAAKRDASVYVIPNGESMTLTIVYDVETKDDNLATYLSDGKTHGSSVQNKITKEVSFSDAVVSNWGDASGSDVWVPENTGAGVYNANNPLTIMSAQAGATAVGLSGASATSYSIAGAGVGSAVKLGATGTATWTVSDPSVALIAASSTSDADTRAVTESDFESSAWVETVDAQYIWIKPLNKGQVTITSSMGGEISTIVITIDAPSITLTAPDRAGNSVSADAITLYLFSTPETRTLAAAVKKASYEDANNETVTFESSDTSIATVNANSGLVTAVAEGTATITAKTSDSGVTATCEVTVATPSITAAVTDISLRQGVVNSVQLKFTMTPSDIDPVFTYVGKDTYYTFDESTYIVTQKALTESNTATIKVQFTGYTADADPSALFNVKVQDADPGIALNNAGSRVVGRVVVSDVAKTYASIGEAEMWGHTPIAVVAYVTTGTEYVDTDAANYQALAIGINDISGTYTWLADGAEAGTDIAGINNYTTYVLNGSNTAMQDFAGIASYTAMKGANILAAKAVADYTVTTPSDPTLGSTSGWFLPSIGQWNKMLVTLAPTEYDTWDNLDTSGDKTPYAAWNTKDVPGWDKTTLNSVVEGKTSSKAQLRNDGYLYNNVSAAFANYGISAVKNSLYWSSTEYNATNAWDVNFYYGIVNNNGKADAWYVRPVLAF